VMLPNAFGEQVIFFSAVSICSLTFQANEKLFTSCAAAKELLEMATRAPTQFALQWTFQAMVNITYNAEDSAPQGYATEENSKILLKAFQRAEGETCVENASRLLFKISCGQSAFSRICTREFASAALDKLSVTKSTDVVAFLYGYIANAAHSHPECRSFFCTKEATKILLRASKLVNNNHSAHHFSEIVASLTRTLHPEPLSFAKEFCAAVVKCFDFVTTDESRESCGTAISNLAYESVRPILASIPSIVEKLHDAIKKMEDLNKAKHLFSAIGNICYDSESARHFATLETLGLLVDSRKKVTDAETLNSIDKAMNRIVSHFPEFLDFCAAQSDATSEYQQRLLKEVTTLEQLASFLENESGDFFELHSNPIVKRRSLLIVFEKLDQLMLSREENNNNNINSEEEFQKFLSRICRKLYSSFNRLWFEILNHQFLDSVAFSLLQNAKGMTCRDAVFLILWRNRSRYPPALSSSLIKVIFEKLDEEDEESCFSKNAGGESFFSLGIQLVRHAVSQDSKDLAKTFFIDNSQLVKRVFKKGRVFGGSTLAKEIDLILGEIGKFSPRTKGMF
jgi:hypothetical protein